MTTAAKRPAAVPVEVWSEQYGLELRRHLTAMLGNEDEARDLVQELWVTALRTRPDSGEGTNIRAWLYRVATRRALDAISARRRRSRLLSAHSGDLQPTRPPAPDTSFVRLSTEGVARVREGIAQLPPKQRNAVWLRWIEGQDYSTIASRLGATPEACRANVYQGMKKLRRSLADLWREEGT